MKNTNLPINLKDNNLLIENDFIMITKAGKLWRCGKGYRKDWDKLIGKLVLLHGQAFILISRIKQDGKWYLVFKDEKHIYTERQDKALHNKNLAKDTIIEELMEEIKIPEIKYQLCLPSARTEIDFIIQNNILHYVDAILNRIKSSRRRKPILYKAKYNINSTDLEKCKYLATTIRFIKCTHKNFKDDLLYEMLNILKRLMRVYHPDITHKNTSTEFIELHCVYTELTYLK